MNYTDEELVRESLSGDQSAYEHLMQRSLKPVFNFVYLYTRSTEETEDIVQDTFFKAWKHLRSFKSGKKWKSWILTIARNTALDFLKKRRLTPFSTLDEPDEGLTFSETVEDTELRAPELFERAEHAQLLAIALEKLRPEFQTVIMLHYHQELTFEDIALIMGSSMNTVKSWHRRALHALKDSLHMHRNKPEGRSI